MLEDIIYTLLSSDYKKDIIPILFINKSLYNNNILWNKIVNKPVGKRNFTLLMYFAACNNYKRVKFLLESGANVNIQDGKKFSVLLYALGASVDKSGVHVCSKCNLKIIEELCKYNINLNLLDNNSDNCIFIAIKLKYSAALNLLLNYDFDITPFSLKNGTLNSEKNIIAPFQA
jgi:ankyrin repeat protein